MSSSTVREYHEALFALETRFAEELAKLDSVSDRDVRKAKATLAVPTEIRERAMQTAAAYDEWKAEYEERWIVAHESLAWQRQVRS